MQQYRGKQIMLMLQVEETVATAAPLQKKGRSTELILRRNEKLADRFYFYSVIGKLQYETALSILSSEFDLAMFTISEIIPDNADYLRRLKMQEFTARDLQKKWPYLNWQNPAPIM